MVSFDIYIQKFLDKDYHGTTFLVFVHARPGDNLVYNYAFVLESAVVPFETLKEAESKFYTFVDKHLTIEWTKMFMAINMKSYGFFDVKGQIFVNFGANDSRKLNYHSRMKQLYAQRIVTRVFSNAHRVDIDLTNIRKR